MTHFTMVLDDVLEQLLGTEPFPEYAPRATRPIHCRCGIRRDFAHDSRNLLDDFPAGTFLIEVVHAVAEMPLEPRRAAADRNGANRGDFEDVVGHEVVGNPVGGQQNQADTTVAVLVLGRHAVRRKRSFVRLEANTARYILPPVNLNVIRAAELAQ
jgi:hypothetical protein